MDQELQKKLEKRGVILHAPQSISIQDVNADAFESDVEIFPSVTIRGKHSCFGRGTKLGKTGGGYFENVATGRHVDLYGGYFQDCVFLDDVVIRGHAEVRGGSILEEGCEAAHHVGYKMTLMLPWVVAGSLINFCDALVAGGTSRHHHSEIGSSLALYNFTPSGDKHASLFGDVPRGVFLREEPIFIGGSTQIVSPVQVGYGTLIPAGASVRRNIPDGTMHGEASIDVHKPFARQELGFVVPKIHSALRYLGNVVALQHWYRYVRIPAAKDDRHLGHVYAHAERQLDAQIRERVKRALALLNRVDASLAAHQTALDNRSDGLSYAQRYRRIDDHTAALAQRENWRAHLNAIQAGAFLQKQDHAQALGKIVSVFRQSQEPSLNLWLRDRIADELRLDAQHWLQHVVDNVASPPSLSPPASS